MKKNKNFFKFLWQDLYNKRSFAIVNIYNPIPTAFIAFLFIYAYKHPHEEGLGSAFAIFFTLLLNLIVYIICHIIFVIEKRKNWVIKDNPVIKNWFYRVICILSFIIVCFHYLLGIFMILPILLNNIM